jgi:UDP-glucose 4-epimerase
LKNILLTGCAGFVGFHLASELVKSEKYFVFGVDNFARGSRDELFMELCKNKNFELIEGDLTSSTFVNSLPSEIDYVVHLAALNGTQNFYSIPFDVSVSCAIPTWNLIEMYRNFPITKFIFTGTPESYASGIDLGLIDVPTSENVPLTITSPHEARWSYATGKTFSEVLLANAYTQFGFPSLILRLHNVYGTRMGKHHFIPDFLERTLLGQFVLEGAHNTRSFLYIDDAVADMISLLESELASSTIINIGSMEERSIYSVAIQILELLKIRVDLKVNAAPSGSVLRRIPNTSLVDKILGERPRVSLQEGLQHCIHEFYG